MNQRLVTFTGIGLIVILLVIVLFVRVNQNNNAPSSVSLANLDTTGQPRLGQEDAPVTLVVFEDFNCSHCRLFNENELPKIEREFIHTGQAKLYFINFAFMGPDSRAAALASECVYKQTPTGFWDYEKILMRSQGNDIYHTRGLVELATTYVADIDAELLQQCIDNDEAVADLEADIALARAVGVDSTPTVIVNEAFAQNYTYDIVAEAIRAELAIPVVAEDSDSEDTP